MYGYSSNNNGSTRGGESTSDRSGGGSSRRGVTSSTGASGGGGGAGVSTTAGSVYTDDWQGQGSGSSSGLRGRDRRENASRIAILQAPDRGSGQSGRLRGSAQTYEVSTSETNDSSRNRDSNTGSGSRGTGGAAFIGDRFQGGSGKISNRGLNYGSAAGSKTDKASSPSSLRNKLSLDSNIYDPTLIKSPVVNQIGINTESSILPNLCAAMENSCFLSEFGDTLSHVLLLIGYALLPTTYVSHLKEGEKVMSHTVSMLRRKSIQHNENDFKTAQSNVPPHLKSLFEEFESLKTAMLNLFGDIPNNSHEKIDETIYFDHIMDEIVRRLPIDVVHEISGATLQGLELTRKQMRIQTVDSATAASKNFDRVKHLLITVAKSLYTNLTCDAMLAIDRFLDYVKKEAEITAQIDELKEQIAENNKLLATLSTNDKLLCNLMVPGDSLLKLNQVEILRQQAAKKAEVEKYQEKELKLNSFTDTLMKDVTAVLGSIEKQTSQINFSSNDE